MSLSLKALTTLATIKAELGIALDDTTSDALLERYINAASDAFMTLIDRDIVKTVRTGTRLKGVNDTNLYLPEYPILSIEQILGYDEGVIDSDEYEIIDVAKESSYVYSETAWFKYSRTFGDLTTTILGDSLLSMTIDYTSGYCTPELATEECPRTLPYDIEELIIEAVCQKYKINCTGTQGMKDYKVGSRSITWTELLKSTDNAIIRRYARVGV